LPSARLLVRFAGPLVSFQDAGRPGNMRFGVPESGPMDRISHAAANVALGNDASATAIEVSMGGLTLEALSGPVTIGIVGGAFRVEYQGIKLASWVVLTLQQGETLGIQAGNWGSWTYVAIAGDLQVPRWLGHTATYSMAGFGGGMLAAEEEIDVFGTRATDSGEGPVPFPHFAQPTGRARVVMGPQDHQFVDEAIAALQGDQFRLSTAYDRMGVRLKGPQLELKQALSIPSEPIIRGSIQVAGDGVPTVLLADHQTTGGYPKIATVISPDLDQLVRLRAGDPIHFEPITPSDAIAIARVRKIEESDYLKEVSKPRRTLTQRLLGENLIGGVSLDPEA